jgi:hypothetical protein
LQVPDHIPLSSLSLSSGHPPPDLLLIPPPYQLRPTTKEPTLSQAHASARPAPPPPARPASLDDAGAHARTGPICCSSPPTMSPKPTLARACTSACDAHRSMARQVGPVGPATPCRPCHSSSAAAARTTTGMSMPWPKDKEGWS